MEHRAVCDERDGYERIVEQIDDIRKIRENAIGSRTLLPCGVNSIWEGQDGEKNLRMRVVDGQWARVGSKKENAAPWGNQTS